LVCLGCGKGKGEVTGKVTYNGTPLTHGTVTIQDSDGAVQQSVIEGDGTYTVKDLATGEAKVSVRCRDPFEVEYAKAMAGRGGQKNRHSKGTPATNPIKSGQKSKGSLIPEKYAEFDQSGLTVNVEKDTKYDIPLK
jgi:hypothetical protein